MSKVQSIYVCIHFYVSTCQILPNASWFYCFFVEFPHIMTVIHLFSVVSSSNFQRLCLINSNILTILGLNGKSLGPMLLCSDVFYIIILMTNYIFALFFRSPIHRIACTSRPTVWCWTSTILSSTTCLRKFQVRSKLNAFKNVIDR